MGLFFAGDVGRLLRGHLLIFKDWNRAKILQGKGEALVKLMEEKKKEIWNFSAVNSSRSQESDKVCNVIMIIRLWNYFKLECLLFTEFRTVCYHRNGHFQNIKEKENYFAMCYMELGILLLHSIYICV